ncbi:MAG: type II secretion system protein [Verrucomicrobiae bacterium]|nr:type II secretion system protein [Verrucomicrobiae bacterium]
MSFSRFPPSFNRRGFTLVEVTLVIAVLLGLISVLFLGVTAYKNGSDRSICIQNISNVQKAVRSYANLNLKSYGDTVANLKDEIIGAGQFFPNDPVCPAGGTYTYGGDTIPNISSAYMSCDVTGHEPKTTNSW